VHVVAVTVAVEVEVGVSVTVKVAVCVIVDVKVGVHSDATCVSVGFIISAVRVAFTSYGAAGVDFLQPNVKKRNIAAAARARTSNFFILIFPPEKYFLSRRQLYYSEPDMSNRIISAGEFVLFSP